MPSKSRLVSKAFSSSGVLSTIASENPTVDTGTTQIANVDALPTSGNETGDQLFIEATNRLYIWNGSGWYNIALINTSPTWDSGGQPASSYELDVDSPQDATIISLAASDAEGLPIQYSYVTSGSMDSMATISQDSSVFTITPKTFDEVGGEVELIGSITFRASDGVNILPSISSFVLNFVFTVENSKYTTLLLEAVDTSDNNNIIDSSSNNHAITVTGDAKAGSYSPYRHGGYSTYFDGSGDYLNIPTNSNLVFGTGDFTIEGWFYLTAAATSLKYLFDCRSGGGNQAAPAIHINSGTFQYYVNGSYVSTGGTVLQNQWMHIALVKTSGSTKLYVDGNLAFTYTDSINYTSSTVLIGSEWSASGSYDWAGYISDFRIVKGTAVYTSNFTPQSTRLTAITNTSLLTCHLPYFADGSTNDHAITVNGNTSTRAFSPYDNKKYSASSHGGSVYLDGSGDYLSVADHTSLDLGTGDFTLEAWIRMGSTSGNQIIFERYTSGNNGSFQLYYRGTGNSLTFWTQADGVIAQDPSSSTIKANTWHHVVAARESGTVKLYVDGSQVASASCTTNFDSTLSLTVGAQATTGTNYFNGYMSDCRIVKGTAVYTSNFTPPTFPLTAITNTSLLLSGTEASIIDKAQQAGNITLASGIVGESTTVVHANSKSINFMADDDIFCTFYNPFTFAGEFTIEFYTRIDSLLNGQGANVNGQYHTMLNLGNYFFVRFGDGGFGSDWQIGTASGFPGIDSIGITPSSMVGNGWYHFAMTRDANNDVRYYWNGTLRNSSGVSIGNPNPSTFPNASVNRSGTFGAVGNATVGCGFRGYMQDIRITNGLVRYTGNFTPPTEPLLG